MINLYISSLFYELFNGDGFFMDIPKKTFLQYLHQIPFNYMDIYYAFLQRIIQDYQRHHQKEINKITELIYEAQNQRNPTQNFR